MTILFFISFFFFSSRRRHTRLQGDWSSDVCSSDLDAKVARHVERQRAPSAASLNYRFTWLKLQLAAHVVHLGELGVFERSEERRVGKECRSRWSPYH